jgi:class 3 adenylate cyclase
MKSLDKSLSLSPEAKQYTHQTQFLLKFSAITVLLILIVSLVLTLFFIKKQRDIHYREKVNVSKIMLSHLTHKAALPLLEEDTLALHILIKEAKEVDGLLYATILDSKKIIKAHSDPAKLGLPFKELESIEAVTKDETTTYSTYRLSSETKVLNLSRPVTFMNKQVGSVNLGFSIDFIQKVIKKETVSLAKNIALFVLILVIIGIGTVFFISRGLSRSGSSDKTLPSETSRNQVAVLYAGIKGFKAYAETRDPEQVLQDLNEYVSIATKNILDYGGYVAKIVGDAVIGVFRSSPLQADQTVRAVESAIAILKAFDNQRGSRNQLFNMVGIGISAGVVLSGYIGSHTEKKYNDIGESFKAADSLHAVAHPGEIVISKDVYQSIENLFSVEPLPPREMTQKTEAWESFRLRHIAGGGPYA